MKDILKDQCYLAVVPLPKWPDSRGQVWNCRARSFSFIDVASTNF